MKILALAGLLAVGTSIGLARIPATEPDVGLNDVIAKVGSEQITYSQLNTMLNSSAIVGLSMPALGSAQRNRVRITLLDKVISANLLYLDAKQKGVDRSLEYRTELTRYQNAILAALYRERHLIGDVGVSDAEIQSFYKDSIKPGTEFTDEVRASIEATLRKEKFKQRAATLRDRLRLGINVSLDESKLDPADDSLRLDADILARIEGSGIEGAISWGDARSILSIASNATDKEARREALNKYLDNEILAAKGRQAGLETDPVYRARVGEFEKTRLITFHRHRLLETMQPDDAAIAAYFEEHSSRISAPESRKIQMVVVDSETEAKALKKRIEAGELTVYQAAMDYSTDPNAKQTLGDYGWVTKGSGFPALDAVAFSLAPDELGGPVKSPAGWHLVKILDLRDARYQSLDDPETRQYVRRMLIKDSLDAYVVNLRKNAFPVVVYDERLNELFTREAEWIAELEEKAAQDPSIAQQRIDEFERTIKR